WDNRRAHVRWTHKTDASADPSLSPPVETKVASVQTPPSPPPTNQSSHRLTTFQRLLIQPFLDMDYDIESDSDSTSE
ncbi:unnamed protein product, partial [Rotaria sp. Silwood1]